MKIFSSFTFLAFIIMASTACKQTESEQPSVEQHDTTEVAKEYALVWSDEFDVDGPPNPDNWVHEQGFVRNEELQWYQEDNAWVENGHLIIEGRRDTFPNPTYMETGGDWRTRRENVYFTSSSIKTQNKHAWTFGRFEIRAKIVAEEGLWPAIWTLGLGYEWPQGGEIDIMEYYDGNILANAAWSGPNRWQAVWDASRTPVEDLGEKWDEEFHIWRMDWDRDVIRIYVDDRLLNTIFVEDARNQRGNISLPFRSTKQYILLNLALGGKNGGNTDYTTFPSRYKVDYVRVYQLQ